MFSKACEYSIRATLYIATESLEGRRSIVKAISTPSDSAETYIAKVLKHLIKAKIIQSANVPRCGFEIDRKSLQKMKLCQIVKGVDRDSIDKSSGLGLNSCNEAKLGAVHCEFKNIHEDLRKILEYALIVDLAARIKTGPGTIKN